LSGGEKTRVVFLCNKKENERVMKKYKKILRHIKVANTTNVDDEKKEVRIMKNGDFYSLYLV